MRTLSRLLLWSSVLVPNSALGQLADTIRSSLLTVDIQSGRLETVYSDNRHFEAPNWSPDGRFFVVNSKGRLYRLTARGNKRLEEIPTGFATRANNDHGISPDGRHLVLSHHAEEHITDPGQDWLASSIYIVPIAGSPTPVKVTTKAPSFWHGWSPDGRTLAFVGRRDGEWDIYTIPVGGGEERRLTTCRGLDDGPDYAPDGEFIYYNSICSGKMEIWRMRPDGSHAEQLTRDGYSNWFPHPSPDGRWVVFLAYLEDQGDAHPFGKQVKLRLMDRRDGSVRDLTPPFLGGQGTINVPSWAPDSRRVAFVAYAAGAGAAKSPNQLTPAERAAGWRLLFDGTSLAGWRGLGYDSVPTAHWRVVDGAIAKTPSAKVQRQADGQPAAGGDLMTIESFRDFELAFEWRVTPGANSGVKYNVSEELSLAHAANHAALGFEYQVLDDVLHPDNKIATHLAGALYDILAPNAAKRLRPVGEWNNARIVLRGNHGEHWLNGVKVVEFDLGTSRMDSLLERSKYKPIAGFAERRHGHIILQDHGDEVYFRSIKIRELTGASR